MSDARLRFKVHLYADHPEHACLLHYLRLQGGIEVLSDAAQQKELKRLIRIGFELPPTYSLMPNVRLVSLNSPVVRDELFVVSFRAQKDAALGGYLRFSPGTYQYRSPSATSTLVRDLAITGFRAICARDMTLAISYGYATAFGMPGVIQSGVTATHPAMMAAPLHAQPLDIPERRERKAVVKKPKSVSLEKPKQTFKPVAATPVATGGVNLPEKQPEIAPALRPDPPSPPASLDSDDFNPMDFI